MLTFQQLISRLQDYWAAQGCALLQPYDIVPLIPIIERAGGVVTDLEGRSPMAGGTVVAAAHPALHAAALEILRG